MMANVKYSNYGMLHTTVGTIKGLKTIDTDVDPYYMEECDLPDKHNGFKILVSEPIRF